MHKPLLLFPQLSSIVHSLIRSAHSFIHKAAFCHPFFPSLFQTSKHSINRTPAQPRQPGSRCSIPQYPQFAAPLARLAGLACAQSFTCLKLTVNSSACPQPPDVGCIGLKVSLRQGRQADVPNPCSRANEVYMSL
jgi:hypothetical protein